METVERAGCVLGPHARAGVDDLHQGAAPGRAEPEHDGRPRRGVLSHVGQQVRQYLANPRFVGHHDQPVRGLELDRAVRFDGARVGRGVAHQKGHVGLGQVQRRGPVEPREFQQFGDQPAHPLRFLVNPAHRVRQLIRAERSLPVEFGVSADGRQRGTELVRGVRGELADLLFRIQPRAECLLDPVQHGVDRVRQEADLRVITGVRHPGGQVTAGGDPPGRGGHLVQGREAPADQPPAAGGEYREQGATRDQFGDDQAAHPGGDPAARLRDHDDAAGTGGQRGPPPGRRERGTGHGIDRVRLEVLANLGQWQRAEAGGELAGVGRPIVIRHDGSPGPHAGDGVVRAGHQLRACLAQRGQQAVVELGLQVAADHERADRPHDHQEDRRHGDQSGQEAGAQRQPGRTGHLSDSA